MRRPSAYRLHKILIFISGLSLSVALTGYLSLTFSWFFFNRSGQTDAPRVKILANLQVTYDIYLDDSVTPLVGDEIVFSDLIPGQGERSVKVVATNTGLDDAKISLGFLAPTVSEEVPYVDTTGSYGPSNYYYYFGSQIQISAVETKVENSNVVVPHGLNSFLVPTSSGGLPKGQVNGVENEITTFNPLSFASDITILVGKTATIKTTFRFVDNTTDQSIYMSAWPSVGVSARVINVSLSEAD